MRRREATIGVFLPKLAGVFAETAHRAQVLALHWDWIARFEPVTDSISFARLRSRGGLAR
jgi:hypothetical protein